MPALFVMSAHGKYDDAETGSRVYRSPGCAAAACRNPGWTVEHTLLALSPTPADALKLLQNDAALLRALLKERYREQLLLRDGAVNIRVASIGRNAGYQIDSEVRARLIAGGRAASMDELLWQCRFTRCCAEHVW